MKANKYLRMVLAWALLALTVFAPLEAATYYGRTTTISNRGITSVTYKVTFDMTTGTDTFYSKSFSIGDLNGVDGYITTTLSNESGTEDVDITYEYSFDGGLTWIAGTADTDYNAVTAGTTSDTLGIHQGTNDLLFHSASLMRVKYAGQSGNPNGTDVTSYITLSYEAVYVMPPPNVANVNPS